MNCMKCGKEAAQGQAFCDDCLAVMAQYPVKPDTVVQLPPKRTLGADRKTSRKKDLSPKELLRRQRKLVKKLQLTVLILLVLLVLAIVLLVYVLYSQTSFFGFIPFLP